jgi:hypothetical protein
MLVIQPGIDITVLRIRIRDQVLFSPQDPGWVKKSGSGSGIQSGMNNPDHFSESLATIFWVKYLNSLMRIREGKHSDPVWNKSRSGLSIPDPQHWDISNSVPNIVWMCAGIDIAGHLERTGHITLQPLGDYLSLGRVRLPNVSYTAAWGQKVRRRWKTLVTRGT